MIVVAVLLKLCEPFLVDPTKAFGRLSHEYVVDPRGSLLDCEGETRLGASLEKATEYQAEVLERRGAGEGSTGAT